MLRFSPPGECESKDRCLEGNQEQRFLAFIGIVKSLKHNKTNSMGDFLIFPPFIVPLRGTPSRVR
jgi:hypothetical protein